MRECHRVHPHTIVIDCAGWVGGIHARTTALAVCRLVIPISENETFCGSGLQGNGISLVHEFFGIRHLRSSIDAAVEQQRTFGIFPAWCEITRDGAGTAYRNVQCLPACFLNESIHPLPIRFRTRCIGVIRKRICVIEGGENIRTKYAPFLWNLRIHEQTISGSITARENSSHGVI